ncbi:hypothetical protein DB346_19840 [Verrucomicrobia bacterium LW23]|nr:hypothetical protein DB346_19840 [Verrucomicrobia bacterium LW23]
MPLLQLSQGVWINPGLVSLARLSDVGGTLHFLDGSQHAVQGRLDAEKVEAALGDFAAFQITEFGETARFLVNAQVVTRMVVDPATRTLKLHMYGVPNALVVPPAFADIMRARLEAAVL